MCVGIAPFLVDEHNNLCIKFAPLLHKDLFTSGKRTLKLEGKLRTFQPHTFCFKLFSRVLVVYHNPRRKHTFSGDITIKQIVIDDGLKKHFIDGSVIKPPLSHKIRQAEVKEIEVYFE
jgi:hypothetical protein